MSTETERIRRAYTDGYMDGMEQGELPSFHRRTPAQAWQQSRVFMRVRKFRQRERAAKEEAGE